MKTYRVWYKKSQMCAMDVNANTPEEARVVGSNLITKDMPFDCVLDEVIDFDQVLEPDLSNLLWRCEGPLKG
jgi:hypothetical protein